MCLFGAINIVKKDVKGYFMYGGYGIVFNAAGEWGFNNDLAKTIIIFDVDNSSSSHTDNQKTYCLSFRSRSNLWY